MNQKEECGKCVFPDDNSRRAYLHTTLRDLCCANGRDFDRVLEAEGEEEFVDNAASLLQLFVDDAEKFVPEPFNPEIFRTTASTVREYILERDYRSLRAFLWSSVLTNANADCNFAELPFVFLAIVFSKSNKRFTRLTLTEENLNLVGEIERLISKTPLNCDCRGYALCFARVYKHARWTNLLQQMSEKVNNLPSFLSVMLKNV